MATTLWYKLSQADRDRYGSSDEWMPIDIDRIMDTPAGRLESWERAAGGYALERVLLEVDTGILSARACRMLVWIGRKQNGDATLKTPDDKPESYAAFDPQTLRIEMTREDPHAAEAEVPAADPLPEKLPEAADPTT